MNFRPALIIGLGGTGFKIANDLESRLDLCGADVRQGPVRFLYLDSDCSQFPQARDPRYVHLTIDAFEVAKAIKTTGDYKNLHVKAWHHPRLTENLTPEDFARGVRGKRPNGRLAFLASSTLAQFCQRIKAELLALRAAYPADQILVAVVASAGGGTGSGCFIDCGYLVKSLAKDLQYLEYVQADGYLLVAAQGVDVDPDKMSNSQAILRELDHFMDRRVTFQAQYPEGALDDILGSEGPYTNLFLAAPKDEDGCVLAPGDPFLAMDILAWRTSDFIFVRLPRDAAPVPAAGLAAHAGGPVARRADMGEIDSRLVDILGNCGPGQKEDPLGYPMTFFTFGCGLRHLPVESLQVIFRDRLRADIANLWLAHESTDPKTRERFNNDVGGLRKELGLHERRDVSDRDPGSDFTHDPRASSSDKVYGRLVRGDPGQAAQVDLEDYFRGRATTRTEVDLVVKEPEAGGVTPESGQPGFLAVTLANRRPAEETRQFEALRSRTMEAAADLGRGPNYAENLLSVLEVDLQIELRQIDRVMQTSLPGEGDAPSGSHPLLLLWSGASRQRDAEDASGPLAAYANAQYERAILRQKRTLLGARKQQVESLKSDLKSFCSCLERWKLRENPRRAELEKKLDNFAAQGEVLPQLADVKRIVYPKAHLEMVYTGLATAFRAGIDWQKLNHPVLEHLKTRTDCPDDFGPFGRVDQTIQDAIDEHVQNLSVLKVMEQQGIPRVDSARRIVAQARNLLHMNLNANGYVQFLTGAPHEQFGQNPWRRYYGRGVPEDIAWAGEVSKAFAQHQGVGQGIDINLDTPTHSVAAVVSVRGSFPTRIGVDYLLTQRDNWLRGSDVSIHFIDSRVLPPLPNDLRRESESLLIAAELLFFNTPGQPIQIENMGNTRTYTVEDPVAHGQRVCSEIPSDFAQATRRLAYNDDLRRCMRGQFLLLKNNAAQAGPWAQILSQTYIAWNNLLMAQPDQAHRNGIKETVGQLTEVPLQDAAASLLEGAKKLLNLDIRPPGVPWFAQNPANGQYHCRHCFRVVGNMQPQVNQATPGQHTDVCPWYRIQTNQI